MATYLSNDDSAKPAVCGPFKFGYPVLLVRSDGSPESSDALPVIGVDDSLMRGQTNLGESDAEECTNLEAV